MSFLRRTARHSTPNRSIHFTSDPVGLRGAAGLRLLIFRCSFHWVQALGGSYGRYNLAPRRSSILRRIRTPILNPNALRCHAKKTAILLHKPASVSGFFGIVLIDVEGSYSYDRGLMHRLSKKLKSPITVILSRTTPYGLSTN